MAILDKGRGGYRVFVGDLGSRVGKYELEREFENFGPITDVWVARNPPGFAFLVYKYAEDAERAVRKLHGRIVCGRRVRVEHAVPYEERAAARALRGSRGSPKYRNSEGPVEDHRHISSTRHENGTHYQLTNHKLLEQVNAKEHYCVHCGKPTLNGLLMIRTTKPVHSESKSYSRSRSRSYSLSPRRRRSRSSSRRRRRSRSRDQRSSKKSGRSRDKDDRSSKSRKRSNSRSRSRSKSHKGDKKSRSTSQDRRKRSSRRSRERRKSGSSTKESRKRSRSPSPSSRKRYRSRSRTGSYRSQSRTGSPANNHVDKPNGELTGPPEEANSSEGNENCDKEEVKPEDVGPALEALEAEDEDKRSEDNRGGNAEPSVEEEATAESDDVLQETDKVKQA